VELLELSTFSIGLLKEHMGGCRFHYNEEVANRECLRMHVPFFYRDGHLNYNEDNDVRWNTWATFNTVLTCSFNFCDLRTQRIEYLSYVRAIAVLLKPEGCDVILGSFVSVRSAVSASLYMQQPENRSADIHETYILELYE